ncbi:MAG: type II toxin-antitoxin system VapC family toxin [Bauldia sp.]|nr:type II toxin-antitoxin system VapC family toxin [Bauldia sp.]
MTDVVLDASVVLAAILEEPGHQAVLELDTPALVSAVNLAETCARLVDRGYDQASVRMSLGLINMRVVDFDAEQAFISAELRPATKASGLSLGDRACLALAHQRGATALTADRAWANLSTPVEVRVVR